MIEHSLIADGLRKRYGKVAALDGFDLRVQAGTIHGLLGPNGAGKSTAVRVAGDAASPSTPARPSIGGHDVAPRRTRCARRSGWSGRTPPSTRSSAAARTSRCSAACPGCASRAARAAATNCSSRSGSRRPATEPVGTYSGGMRRRLDIAASIILRPAVLFLDEPTTGLDPRGRNEVWTTIRELVAAGHDGAAHHPVPRRGRQARRRASR